jgi:hypothetical protein
MQRKDKRIDSLSHNRSVYMNDIIDMAVLLALVELGYDRFYLWTDSKKDCMLL